MQEYLGTTFSSTIVLADDDADDRDLFQEAVAFVDPAIRLTMKRDGEELMDYLLADKQLPDLVFIDLNMPRKNGKECLYAIKRHAVLSKIPVIIYTTSINPIDIEQTYNEGAIFFFRKPNSYEELKETLRKLLTENDFQGLERTKSNFVLNKDLKLEYK